jgi:hypothetical protein
MTDYKAREVAVALSHSIRAPRFGADAKNRAFSFSSYYVDKVNRR